MKMDLYDKMVQELELMGHCPEVELMLECEIHRQNLHIHLEEGVAQWMKEGMQFHLRRKHFHWLV